MENFEKGKIIMRVTSYVDEVEVREIFREELLNENNKNNECMKYTHFLFDRAYTKYTGIDKKYFDKLMNNKEK